MFITRDTKAFTAAIRNRIFTFLRALVNSNTTGAANLQNVLSGSQFADYLRDWSVSLIADDFSPSTTAALSQSYIMPSWNFRSIYPGLRFTGGAALGVYPIATRSLLSGSPQRVLLAECGVEAREEARAIRVESARLQCRGP